MVETRRRRSGSWGIRFPHSAPWWWRSPATKGNRCCPTTLARWPWRRNRRTSRKTAKKNDKTYFWFVHPCPSFPYCFWTVLIFIWIVNAILINFQFAFTNSLKCALWKCAEIFWCCTTARFSGKLCVCVSVVVVCFKHDMQKHTRHRNIRDTKYLFKLGNRVRWSRCISIYFKHFECISHFKDWFVLKKQIQWTCSIHNICKSIQFF